MANVGGERGGIGERRRSREHMVEEIEPSSAWTDDPNSHYLLLGLPGFTQEEVKLEVDDYNQITVSGERLVKDKSKIIYFEKTFKLPENSDINMITGKLDGEMLCVTVPKQALPERRMNNEINDDQNHHHHDNNVNYPSIQEQHSSKNSGRPDTREEQIDELDREILRRWAREITPLGKAIEIVKRNRGILLIVILAFSIGVLVSRGHGMNTL